MLAIFETPDLVLLFSLLLTQSWLKQITDDIEHRHTGNGTYNSDLIDTLFYLSLPTFVADNYLLNDV